MISHTLKLQVGRVGPHQEPATQTEITEYLGTKKKKKIFPTRYYNFPCMSKKKKNVCNVGM